MDMEKKHNRLLYNHIIALHIFCTFIALSVALKSIDENYALTSLDCAYSYPGYFLPFAFLLLVEIILFYILVKNDLFYTTNIYNYLVVPIYVGFPLLVTLATINIIDVFPNLEIILLLPILIAASTGKKKVTYWSTALVVFLYVLLDVVKYGGLENIITHSNIILISIMILVGWFSASVSDLELKSRKKLEFSEKRVHEILNFLPDATFTIDNTGKIIFWNRAMEKISNIRAKEILGQGNFASSQIFFGERIPGIAHYIINPNLMEKNKNNYYSLIKEKKDFLLGEMFAPCIGEKGAYFLVKGTALFDENKQQSGAIVSLKEVSEIKFLQQEMARMEKLNMLGQMAASITHEIRNPMTIVKGSLQLLSQKDENKDEELFPLMIDEIDRANEIISDYLSLSKTSKTELRYEDLNAIINSVVPLISADANMSGKEVYTDLNKIPLLLLDKKEISQLILNLSRNGLEAMEGRGKLTIKTTIEDKHVVLSIQDQGCGISEDIKEKLGMPFFTTKENGTGLGLSVCYSIANSHNAVIEVDSGDWGTIFYIKFRLLDNKAQLA